MLLSSLPQSFVDKFMPVPESGCWLWLAGKQSGGYGACRHPVTNRMILAHRFFYEALRGPIPPGLQIDHLCRVRSCVNPNHMECVTCRENLLRGVSPAAQHARQTHCASGHLLLGDNVRPCKRYRQCRICNNKWQRQRRSRLAMKNS